MSKYDLSSVTLEKFFLGPLPESLTSTPSHSPSPPPTVKPPAINGCLSPTDFHPAAREKSGPVVNDVGVIDLTEDDCETVPTVKKSSVAKKRVRTKNSSTQKNHRVKQGWLVCLS